MDNKLISRMQYEPAVFIAGNDITELSKAVLDYPWNTVLTTNTDWSLATFFNNGKRKIQDTPSVIEIKESLLDKNNLHLVRLINTDTDEFDMDFLEDEIEQRASQNLDYVISIIKRNGIVVIEDFNDQFVTHKLIRTILNKLSPFQHQVFIFNVSDLNDKYYKNLEKNGIATLYEESIDDYFVEYIESVSAIDENHNNGIHIYMNSEESGRVYSIDKADLLETNSFAQLLSVEAFDKVIVPPSMMEEYFYAFLKNSAREPQWYGYKYGFNIKREYEDELYERVKNGLEKVGQQKNKPLLLAGQTATGKSIALGSISYRVFNEQKYPVVFINNPDIIFHKIKEKTETGVRYTESVAFMALDNLVKLLEDHGAKATLIVWDTSCYSSGREKIRRLYNALLSRGRKVFVLASAYETKYISSEDNTNSIEASVLYNKFNEIKATLRLTNEITQLRGILVDKCHLSTNEVEEMFRPYKSVDSSFLTLFYYVFGGLRNTLSSGVDREAGKSLSEIKEIMKVEADSNDFDSIFSDAFKAIGGQLSQIGIDANGVKSDKKQRIGDNVERFIKCIAFAGQFKFSVPYDYALRILDTYNPDIIKYLTQASFFIINKDSSGDYDISIRTPLESRMYLRANKLKEMDQIDILMYMLDNLETKGRYGQNKEFKLCEKLLVSIGPNSQVDSHRYSKGYPNIINSLSILRTQRGIWDSMLVTQEVTYIREYYGKNNNLTVEDRIKWLEKAISVASEMLEQLSKTRTQVGVLNVLKVETVNSKLILYTLKKTNDARSFELLRNDLRDVIRNDNLNYHAYVTLLKSAIIEYDNELDDEKKYVLLESMCSLIDQINQDNEDITGSVFYQRQVAAIYSLLQDTTVLQEFVNNLIDNGSAAGLYLIAKKKLLDAEVDFRNDIANAKQYDSCKEVYDLFSQPEYTNVIMNSEACVYLLLNIKWLMYSGKAIYQRGQCWRVGMNEEQWMEILSISEEYLNRFSLGGDEESRTIKSIKYIQALSQAELKEYEECFRTIRSIGEDSTVGIERTYTKHIICESDGVPRKFIGRIEQYNVSDKTGTLKIGEFGNHPIYFYAPNLNTSDFEIGRTFTDIEIGLNYIGPRAYRNLEKRVKAYD